MTSSRASKICLCAVVVFSFVACKQGTTTTQQPGSGSQSPSAAPAGAATEIDACKLLSQGEVAGETGYQLEEPSTSRTKSQCPWPSANPDKLHTAVLFEASLTDQSADDLISGFREQMSGAGYSVTSVSGVGDKALAVTGEDAGPIASVYAVKASGGKNAVLRLNIGGESGEPFDYAGKTEEAKSLIKTAISRLP
jgi:hypothetical protein